MLIFFFKTQLTLNNVTKILCGLSVVDKLTKKNQVTDAFWRMRRPLEVSLSTISALDFPPSRYLLESKTRMLDLTLLSP